MTTSPTWKSPTCRTPSSALSEASARKPPRDRVVSSLRARNGNATRGRGASACRVDLKRGTPGCARYWRVMAILKRSSGVIKRSGSSPVSPMSICPLDRAGEAAALGRVVSAARRRGVGADVAALLNREEHRHGRLDTAFAGLRSVEIERDPRALCRVTPGLEGSAPRGPNAAG